jgi:hypothetical protein
MPSTLTVWPEGGIPMNSCCREPVTTHRVATVSPLDVLQVLSYVGEGRLEARDLLLEAGQRRLMVGRWIWSIRPGSQSSSIVAWSPARNASSKRVMISMLSDKAISSLSAGVDSFPTITFAVNVLCLALQLRSSCRFDMWWGWCFIASCC